MIRFINLHHIAGDRDLYTNLNWHIKPGERIGLVGDNGTGKTTLLRMAVGEAEPTEGSLSFRKGIRIGFLKQEIHAALGEETVLQEAMKAYEVEQQAEQELHALYEQLADAPESEYEDMFDRIHVLDQRVRHHNPGAAEADARKILAGLGFTIDQQDQPLSEFSGGWQMRAHIARLLLEQPDVLMLDEPTNHLDLESINWLEQFLDSFPGALIVVSHDRYFLDKITTRTAWVHNRRLDSYATNYSGFLKEREEAEDLLMRRYKNQQDELAHHERFIDRFRAKASKASAVQSRVKMLDKVERIEIPDSVKRVRLRIPEPAPCGRHMMELRGVGKCYGDLRVFRTADLKVEWGDRIALVGRNGAGKSTLLKICAGVLDHEGEIDRHSKLQSEYFSQHRIDALNMDNSVLQEVKPTGSTHTEEQLRTLLGCFLFSGDDAFKPVRVLSGGEKSRLALARMMLRRGNLLLLDEPTNHLDISTREVLQEALCNFPGAVILISHDRYFIDRVATRVVEVGNGTIVNYHGNYADYLKKKGLQEASAGAEADLRGRAGAESGKGKKPAADPNADIYDALRAIESAKVMQGDTKGPQSGDRRERAERRNEANARLRKVEREIEVGEKRLAEIHALQADPTSYTSGKITPELVAELKALESKLPTLMKEWESLGSEVAELKAR